ncbi:hypothetical protein SH528x_003811 [Novipirellula sp. SH528]|uniref:hypothetical protein n=1 Tax=Novipirellula sp. SH528 TaxID=3454466 RepID=UPI003FA170A0
MDELREKVQLSLAQRAQPQGFGKTQKARVRHNSFPLIRRELSLGAIYTVRNPLSVVDSVADHWGCSINQAVRMLNIPRHSIGGGKDKLVRQYLQNWSMQVRSWIDQPAFPTKLLRYEDLLSNTELTINNV